MAFFLGLGDLDKLDQRVRGSIGGFGDLDKLDQRVRSRSAGSVSISGFGLDRRVRSRSAG
ncbi:hypothetical protein A5788_02700 [Gordonia sp. 852002-50816_SCH5313054-c]|nr:hypothetical protein A5766_23360 [Gordonia sp. 852002-51296_SCH5728562-b]OBA65331.1 hypothetical protein A5777_20765 [Gordonia sp. 852002-10350_SCH5691597]OBC03607.1 hypothetical protein A5786_13945 [Gordonia sp. 852002-50816_SCH5313054-a]OBC09647.1 hypothetical protein A5785_04360 [Gordonia sp. 852002-50395_SCH5434458]OBC19049.1 hypothetical protein A5788_02700 [Gordonia sp. 852002-50816_SCH5313054-c]